MRRGQRGADRFRRIISRTVTEQPCGSVVGRLLDTFDEDASGVSARQHSSIDFEVRITHAGSLANIGSRHWRSSAFAAGQVKRHSSPDGA